LLAASELLQRKGVQLLESNRGGDITFHGPGQLVGYPIFDLRGFSPRVGAVEFVRRLEEALIRACGDLGIPCERICGLTGVWTQSGNTPTTAGSASPGGQNSMCSENVRASDQKKIAAIGVHISQGVTSHGFALNVTTDLDYFKLIVPCGISDRPVTSIAQELAGKRVPSLEEVAHSVSLNFGRVFDRQMLWLESLDALLGTSPSSQDLDEAAGQSESTTIGVPLQVPKNLRQLRREQSAPELDSGDDISFA
jgi:lipoyl(octanoyl) transferase